MWRLLILFFVVIMSVKCRPTLEEDVQDSRPNIILILADDLGYGEIGAYGQQKIETPNIDALAKEGMLFTQFYSGAPVCAPARASLLTGQHLGHSPIRGNDEWKERGKVWDYEQVIQDSTLEGQRPLPDGTKLWPLYLQNSGYRTGMVGKWGLGAPHTNSIPNEMGFDFFYGYNCQRQAHTYTPHHLYHNRNRVLLGNDTIAPGTGLHQDDDINEASSYAPYTHGVYAPERSFEQLMHFVQEEGDQPFFLYWATPIPHLPLQAPKHWVDYYRKKFGNEVPYSFKRGDQKYYFPCQYPRATYAAMVSYLDENIGKLITHLKKTGAYDNTIIMFTSDNGPSYTGGTDSEFFDSAGPFQSKYGRGKGFVYEGGIRVPMIVTWPKVVKPKTHSNHVSAFWDIQATIRDITKIDDIPTADGISFLPTLAQQEQEQHPYLYWEFPEYNGQIAVRIDNHKLIWKDIHKGNKHVELYDLTKDTLEVTDISAQRPELVTRMYEIIQLEHSPSSVERFRISEADSIFNNQPIK